MGELDQLCNCRPLITTVPICNINNNNNSRICKAPYAKLQRRCDRQEQCAAVLTRAMVARESKPPKPLMVKSMPGLDIGPDELKAKQKADPTLRKYWELADKTVDGAKQQFFTKKVILYRRYCGKQNTDNLIQLVVPNELREKVVSLALDTFLAGHRGAGKTLAWLGGTTGSASDQRSEGCGFEASRSNPCQG